MVSKSAINTAAPQNLTLSKHFQTLVSKAWTALPRAGGTRKDDEYESSLDAKVLKCRGRRPRRFRAIIWAIILWEIQLKVSVAGTCSILPLRGPGLYLRTDEFPS